jgi:hypothetical protein
MAPTSRTQFGVAPRMCRAGPFTPVQYSRVLEREWLPDRPSIVTAARWMPEF